MKDVLILGKFVNMKVAAVLLFLPLFFMLFPALGADAESFAQNRENKVLSVPVQGQIGRPKIYIIRRALSVAESGGYAAVVLDMNTPGGDLASTLEIMRMVSESKRPVYCYVNTDAISAGSYIASCCEQIWFAPKGVIGAAEAVSSTGADISEAMKRKISSYLSAKVKAYAGRFPYRAEVQRAFSDADYVLKIDGKTLKKEGELLSLTADEAAKIYAGFPLLSSGTAVSENALLDKIFGVGNFSLEKFDLAMFERISEVINALSSVLIGLGVFLIVLEFKFGAGGALGLGGGACLLVVFLGAYLAGLSGYEEIAVFALGALLILADAYFFGFSSAMAVLGAAAVVGALIFALSGSGGTAFSFDAASLLDGAFKVSAGIIGGFIFAWIFFKAFAKSPLWRKIVPQDGPIISAESFDGGNLGGSFPELGLKGVAVGDLSPNGKILINGRTVEAALPFGRAKRGTLVEVVGKKDFYFVVKAVKD